MAISALRRLDMRGHSRVVTNARQDVGAPGIPVASAAKRMKKEWIASLRSQ